MKLSCFSSIKHLKLSNRFLFAVGGFCFPFFYSVMYFDLSSWFNDHHHYQPAKPIHFTRTLPKTSSNTFALKFFLFVLCFSQCFHGILCSVTVDIINKTIFEIIIIIIIIIIIWWGFYTFSFHFSFFIYS